MNNQNLNISKKYRTIHSINDADVRFIDSYINADTKVFLDYGCHFGHLAIYLAKTYNITIYAVDNFVGTIGDNLMQNTIKNITQNSNFYDKTLTNIKEARPYLGKIILQYSDEYLNNNNTLIDFAFIDSSHRVEEANEFPLILSKVRPGGLIGGHDFSQNIYGEGVRKGIGLIEKNCSWVKKSYTWLMRKNSEN